MTQVRVAAAQFSPQIAEVGANCARMLELACAAAACGARLVVFPECALSGYCFVSLEEAEGSAEPVPGSSTNCLAGLCTKLGITIVAGLLERDGERLYNAAAVITPDGIAGTYRKIHLPCLGVDRFVCPGDRPFRVYDTPAGRVGVNICYDGSFPESARVMALDGADLIVLPTNWPQAAYRNASFIAPARALENRVYYLACDRSGEERGWKFYGHSLICDVQGDRLAEAGEGEEIIYADLDLDLARQKRIVHVPGEYELDRIGNRRPEFYGRIVET